MRHNLRRGPGLGLRVRMPLFRGQRIQNPLQPVPARGEQIQCAGHFLFRKVHTQGRWYHAGVAKGSRWKGYALSLPERALRSATALAGGLVREIGEVAVPAALRRTRLYRSLVDSTLRFLIEQVGQVEGAYPGESTLAENFISYIVARVLETRQDELAILERDISKLEAIVPPFPRLQYDDAAKMLDEAFAAGKLENQFQYGSDLGSPDETYISSQYDKPVMVHRYPAAVKAFYMEPDPENPNLALCVDVLAPEGYGEIIGGGERASSLDLLLQRIHEHNLPPEAFDWYLDLRKYGSVPHAGFGMGIERCVTWLCGIEHVRETIPFARMLYRLKP